VAFQAEICKSNYRKPAAENKFHVAETINWAYPRFSGHTEEFQLIKNKVQTNHDCFNGFEKKTPSFAFQGHPSLSSSIRATIIPENFFFCLR
jgi:hypothetical protein